MTKTAIEKRIREIKDRQKWLRNNWNDPAWSKARTALTRLEDAWYEKNQPEFIQLGNELRDLQRKQGQLEDKSTIPQGAPLTVVFWAEQHLVKSPQDRKEKLVGWTENGLVAVHAPGCHFWNGRGSKAYSPSSVEIYSVSKPRKEQGLFGIVKTQGRVSQKRLLELFKEAEKKLGLI